MGKRRLQLLAPCLLVVMLAALFAWFLLAYDAVPSPLQAAFQKIQRGMTVEEVGAVLWDKSIVPSEFPEGRVYAELFDTASDLGPEEGTFRFPGDDSVLPGNGCLWILENESIYLVYRDGVVSDALYHEYRPTIRQRIEKGLAQIRDLMKSRTPSP